MSTPELVERAQRGDHAAFEALATAVYDRLFAVARRIVRDHDLAKDAVQDALIRAWKDLPTLRDPSRLDAWIYRLVVNSCKNQLRAARRHAVDVEVTDLNAPVGPDEMRQVADRDELERMFAKLSVEHRAVLVLVHYLGIPASEVAEILQIPVGTVYSRLHYGAEEARSVLDNGAGLAAHGAGAHR